MSMLRKMRRQRDRKQGEKVYSFDPLLVAAGKEYRKLNQGAGTGVENTLKEMIAIGVATEGSTVDNWHINPDWKQRCADYIKAARNE